MTQLEKLEGLLLSRRRLVQAGTGATAVLVFGSLGPLAPAMAAGVPGYVRRAGYAGLVGTSLIADGGSELRIDQVSDLVRAHTEPDFAGRDDAFALSLTGPPGLRAAIHKLRHPALGSFTLFLAPVGIAGRTQSYEIVVDRSVRLADALERAPEPLAEANAAPAPSETGPAAPAAEPGREHHDKKSGKKAKAKPRRVLSATVARRGGVLTADVRVARGRGLRAVQLLLVREDITWARGFRRLGKRVGVRVTLRELGAVATGDYSLHVTTTDRHGRHATSKHRVTLR